MVGVDGGEDGDDRGAGGGVEDDPEDDEQALFDPQTDQQPFLPRFLDERTSDTEYPLKDYHHPQSTSLSQRMRQAHRRISIF